MPNQITYYMRQTLQKEVAVDQKLVAELIGPERAKELQIFCVNKCETRTTRVGPRSAIPAQNRILESALAQYNREELLDAIEEVQGVGFQSVDLNQLPVFSGTPNPAVTPASHVKKLQDRGFLPS
jgi:hypothetical protein